MTQAHKLGIQAQRQMNTSIRLIALRAFSLAAACSRRILLTLCFLSGLLCAPVAAADEPAPAAVQELDASAVEGEFAPILLIDHGDPSRPVVNEFVRDLQRLSGRAGQRRKVVVESIRQQGGQTIHRLDQSVYLEYSIVLLHGRPAYEYAEACFERQLFLPGTQFLLLQRYGQEPVVRNQEFFNGVRAIDTGDLYPQETLPAGPQTPIPRRVETGRVSTCDSAQRDPAPALATALQQTCSQPRISRDILLIFGELNDASYLHCRTVADGLHNDDGHRKVTQRCARHHGRSGLRRSELPWESRAQNTPS